MIFKRWQSRSQGMAIAVMECEGCKNLATIYNNEDTMISAITASRCQCCNRTSEDIRRENVIPFRQHYHLEGIYKEIANAKEDGRFEQTVKEWYDFLCAANKLNLTLLREQQKREEMFYEKY